MRKIIYYVAISVDGFISGPNEDISGFVQDGKGVEKYLEDLKEFDTVIMGRKTYEFGYKYGLVPGQPAYSHMDHYIFSRSLNFNDPHQKVKVCKLDLEIIRNLKNGDGSDIYLCGGGEFAGWLLENELIDILKVKLNPIVLGAGVKMFGNFEKNIILDLCSAEEFDHGLLLITYNIKYHGHQS